MAKSSNTGGGTVYTEGGSIQKGFNIISANTAANATVNAELRQNKNFLKR